MPGPRLSSLLRKEVRQRAGRRCEYCQTPEWLIGMEHDIDHIVPRAHGGENTIDNLCLACSSCNGFKHAKTYGIDRESGEAVKLFHPRKQDWNEHFVWDETGTRVLGTTPFGRATIESLQVDHPLIVIARSIWIEFGYHPPRIAS